MVLLPIISWSDFRCGKDEDRMVFGQANGRHVFFLPSLDGKYKSHSLYRCTYIYIYIYIKGASKATMHDAF